MITFNSKPPKPFKKSKSVKTFLKKSPVKPPKTPIPPLLLPPCEPEKNEVPEKSPFVNALERKSVRELLHVISQGYDINIKDDEERTPLHSAAFLNSPDKCIQALIKYKADINAIDKKGNTPLHVAAIRGNYTAITHLLEAGANRNTENKKSETPEKAAYVSGLLRISDSIKNFTPNASPVTSASVASVEPPEEFLCPITHDIMKNAVVAPSGHSYDEDAIKTSLEYHNLDPLTNTPLTVQQLIPNRVLRGLIEKWLQNSKTNQLPLVKHS